MWLSSFTKLLKNIFSKNKILKLSLIRYNRMIKLVVTKIIYDEKDMVTILICGNNFVKYEI